MNLGIPLCPAENVGHDEFSKLGSRGISKSQSESEISLKHLRTQNISRIADQPVLPVGFGMLLIRSLADEVVFNAAAGAGHCLKMAIKK